MQTDSELTVDERAGSRWLAHAATDARVQLVAGLLSRFNHDLRTPLNTILGWTHLLQQGAVDAARSKHVAEVIARNSREQTNLLEELVDDGRAVIDVLKLERVDVAFDRVVAAALDRMAPTLSLHGVTLQSLLNVEGCTIKSDERRLQRLLFRLLTTVARRARENSTLVVTAVGEQGGLRFELAADAHDGDWSEPALLDLRISTIVAALLGGTLDIGVDPLHPQLRLHFPVDC